MAAIDISQQPIHLGRAGSAVEEPEFTGDMAWYADYESRHAADGREGRLVALHRFEAPWSMWERHPHGAEVVLCIDGAITLHQEQADGSVVSTTLSPGQYAINEPGVWHTADVSGAATALFITAGSGTDHRAR